MQEVGLQGDTQGSLFCSFICNILYLKIALLTKDLQNTISHVMPMSSSFHCTMGRANNKLQAIFSSFCCCPTLFVLMYAGYIIIILKL